MDEWIDIAKNSIVPAVKKEKGFKGFVMLVNRSAEKSIGYSIWETEADLKTNERSGSYREQKAKLKDILAMPPVREIYELTVLA